MSNSNSPTPPAVAPAAPSGWPKALRRGPMEMLACGLITLGILMLLQPLALILYTWSFVTMLVGTVLFMVVSKFPQ